MHGRRAPRNPPSSNCIFVCILPIQKRLGFLPVKKNKNCPRENRGVLPKIRLMLVRSMIGEKLTPTDKGEKEEKLGKGHAAKLHACAVCSMQHAA